MALTNALNGVNLTAIAQETAKTLLPQLVALKRFTLDLSNDISERGQAVVTRVVQSFSATDLSNGYSTAASNTTTTSVTVTLTNFSGAVVGFTDKQVSESSIDLQTMVYEPLANAAAYGFYSALLSAAQVNSTNFPQNYSIASANFDSNALSDVNAILAKAFVPVQGRMFLGNADIFNALRKDTSFKAAYAYGNSQVIMEGQVGRGMGFDLVEFPWLTTANAGVTAIACGRQALIFAARRVADPTNWYGLVENITIADIPFQLRMWYDGNAGLQYLSFGCLYGVATIADSAFSNSPAYNQLVRINPAGP
jgi:hypothetical protein